MSHTLPGRLTVRVDASVCTDKPVLCIYLESCPVRLTVCPLPLLCADASDYLSDCMSDMCSVDVQTRLTTRMSLTSLLEFRGRKAPSASCQNSTTCGSDTSSRSSRPGRRTCSRTSSTSTFLSGEATSSDSDAESSDSDTASSEEPGERISCGRPCADSALGSLCADVEVATSAGDDVTTHVVSQAEAATESSCR